MEKSLPMLSVASSVICLVIGFTMGEMESRSWIESQNKAIGEASKAYDMMKVTMENVRESVSDIKSQKCDVSSVERRLDTVDVWMASLGTAIGRPHYCTGQGWMNRSCQRKHVDMNGRHSAVSLNSVY